MSIKHKVLHFLTEEEAAITKQAMMSTGSVLAVILGIAVLLLAVDVQPVWAQVCCVVGNPGCCGSPDCSDWYDITPYCGSPGCHRYERSCRSGCVEYWIGCFGCPSCSCP